MVDMSHYRNNGRARHKAFDFFNRIGLLLEKHLLGGFFGLIFKLDAEPRRNKRSGIVVDALVNRLHYAFLKEAFGYFCRAHAKLFGKNL